VTAANPFAQEPLFTGEDVPAPAPFVPDWGVRVQETRIFATRLGVDWWLLYSSRFEGTPRMTCLGHLPQGADWHVACDSKEDAQWLAEHMVSHGGIPKAAVEVKQLKDCRRWSS
jgi:hypothetical protein